MELATDLPLAFSGSESPHHDRFFDGEREGRPASGIV